ncbi:MAG TPA: FlgD immunoglobulin-like domain containing protein [Actinomycetota bacterium]|nr:FlgD immunoglobulin-like domain containing protein [Actinomycetota bacterium]
MRKGACCLVVMVLVGSLGTGQASASYGAIVQIPTGTIYSPFAGPATVTFTFARGDPAEILTVRIRQPGHAGITSETFTLLPKLVDGLSATPSPFYPLVQDGYKDRTRIGFSLAADSDDTVARVFRADDFGRCCGPEIRTESLGPLATGTHAWAWDGMADDASIVRRGTYFARISASDTDGASMTSKAQRVAVTTGVIRRTATKQKRGSAFDRTADEQPTARGGDCHVSRDREIHAVDILCANAEISVVWRWFLRSGERIESVSFSIDGGYYGCRRAKGHSKTSSYLRVSSPPTSTCGVVWARIRYSYPVRV